MSHAGIVSKRLNL